MSVTLECGEVSQKIEVKSIIEWTIKDIYSSMEQNIWFHSPVFTIAGSKWYLAMDPTDDIDENSDGSSDDISLRLSIAADSTFPKKANFSFGVRKANGDIEQRGKKFTHEFLSPSVCVYNKFLNRSILERRKSELTSSGCLTVTCTFKDNIDPTSRLVKLSENFEDMLTSKRFCDGKLRVKQKEFSIHKTVLASRCPVFAAMFELDMKEKNTGIVDIEDCDPEPFNDFLVYLYSGKFQTDSNNVWELYKIADKYGTIELKSDCALFIANNLTVKNVLDAVLLGDRYNESVLISKSRDFFIGNFSEIVSMAEWDLFNKNENVLANQLIKSMGEKLKLKKIKLDSPQEIANDDDVDDTEVADDDELDHDEDEPGVYDDDDELYDDIGHDYDYDQYFP